MPTPPETFRFPPGPGIPNHPRWPALLCRGALADASVGRFRALFERHGWGGSWDWTVYDFHHYHPASHEVLGIARGRARLVLGGPQGGTAEVAAGDALILPAGFGHRLLEGSDDFRVVGAYPPGQEAPEVVRADEGRAARDAATIAALPCPEGDPLAGPEGPLTRLWR